MIKKICHLLFITLIIISIFILIKYSIYEVVDLPYNLENYFLKPDISDGIVFNLAIGYIVSSIFYLMIVYFPESAKKKKVTKVALSELATVCSDSMILIVQMYKNVCLESEWEFDSLMDDKDFFDNRFYERIQRFDIYKNADTLLCEDEEPYNALSWAKKILKEFEDYVIRIDNTINRYIYFLDDELTESALAFKNNSFISTYLGLPSNKLVAFYTGNNGIKYTDKVPLYLMLYNKNERKINPIFKKNDTADNIGLLKDYIKTLLRLREYCNSVSEFDKKRGINLFCNDGCGQYKIAIHDEFLENMMK